MFRSLLLFFLWPINHFDKCPLQSMIHPFLKSFLFHFSCLPARIQYNSLHSCKSVSHNLSLNHLWIIPHKSFPIQFLQFQLSRDPSATKNRQSHSPRTPNDDDREELDFFDWSLQQSMVLVSSRLQRGRLGPNENFLLVQLRACRLSFSDKDSLPKFSL